MRLLLMASTMLYAASIGARSKLRRKRREEKGEVGWWRRTRREWQETVDSVAQASWDRKLRRNTSESSCTTIAFRHIEKCAGLSMRKWMLDIDLRGTGRFYGPTTWLGSTGRCGLKDYLTCCDPSDSHASTDCKPVKLTSARSAAFDMMSSANGSAPLTPLLMLEFHWPDSGLGRFGEPHTFLQMLPRLSHVRTCTAITATMLRDPITFYPSLQRHQFPAMYATIMKGSRANVTACDYAGFVWAFPNMQAWRLSSNHWVQPPLSILGHAPMLAAASRVLDLIDVVGTVERIGPWLELLCTRAGIRPCPPIERLNVERVSRQHVKCPAPDMKQLQEAVSMHAEADVQLHAIAARRLEADLTSYNLRTF